MNSQQDYSCSLYRENGYLDTLKEAGLPVYPEFITHVNDVDYSLALSAALNMLSGKVRPDAVFWHLRCVRQRRYQGQAGQLGLSVPEDVAVMGFDNVALCNMTIPTISTVSQPMYQLGWQSSNLLIDQLEGIPVVSKRIVLNTDIIVRKST